MLFKIKWKWRKKTVRLLKKNKMLKCYWCKKEITKEEKVRSEQELVNYIKELISSRELRVFQRKFRGKRDSLVNVIKHELVKISCVSSECLKTEKDSIKVSLKELISKKSIN